MKFVIHILCCWCLLLNAAYAQSGSPEQLPPKSVEALLSELAKASLSEALPILEQLEQTGSETLVPVFNAMISGDLYANEESGLVLIELRKDGATTYLNPLSNKLVGDELTTSLNKIRVNNRLRTYLRGAVARIQISAASATTREQAVVSLLGDLTPDTVVTIEKALLKERNTDVRAAMETAVAMNRAQASTDPLIRIEAVRTLGESQYAEVRNLLDQMKQSEEDAALLTAINESLRSMKMRSDFYGVVDQLFFGLSLGSVLLLAAIGLAITFGVMGVINMAHGEMMMLGAYTTYVVQLAMPNLIDYSLWVSIPLAFLVAGCVGVLIERCVIRFLHGRPLETLLATFGISLILQQAVRTIFSPLNRQVSQPSWMSGSVEINPELSITLNRLYIFVFALIVFFVLQLILKKTSLGLNVRAVSQNRNMAKSMGIRTGWVDAMTFGLGSGIAGIAGVALSQLTNVGPNLGQNYIIDSFMVVVFGGVGNLLGTLVAAFSLGIANKFLEPVTGAVLASIIVLVFIILFIQKRPKGLFPQKGRAAE
ncbi:amino acid/amide ABC transporter membrane protein 1 (HAAT family) [Limnobacter thiooxidans]|uniref:Urea ABC transporter permease subunit UrtB n=1 Tax=Limnobacter thiooxidans TaxID=131080 RepID=A0AA86JFW0_9BURK|nr:amino acid/amide ABC transporter membrane protein 1 (HAAT family) [Limnobacter thiooxidans]BET26241.1 urea ABC transporter permease subunit UrtB [Limnobacter thiooxidans]